MPSSEEIGKDELIQFTLKDVAIPTTAQSIQVEFIIEEEDCGDLNCEICEGDVTIEVFEVAQCFLT